MIEAAPKHRREVAAVVDPRTAAAVIDSRTQAEHVNVSNPDECPKCRPHEYAAKHARHRATDRRRGAFDVELRHAGAPA